jgi:hypothetical protein
MESNNRKGETKMMNGDPVLIGMMLGALTVWAAIFTDFAIVLSKQVKQYNKFLVKYNQVQKFEEWYQDQELIKKL